MRIENCELRIDRIRSDPFVLFVANSPRISDHDEVSVGSPAAPDAQPECQLFFAEAGHRNRCRVCTRNRAVASTRQERQSEPVSRRNRAAGCAEPQAAAAEIQFSDRKFQGHQLPWISRRRDLSLPWTPGADGE